MDTEGYEGWKNYETWCMALWIDNDEGSYNESRVLVSESAAAEVPRWAEGDPEVFHNAQLGAVAAALQVWQEDLMPDLPASVWSDLLRAAFSEIDWYEIAENYLSEVTA